MPTRKKSPAKKATKSTARQSGPLPPYGIAIRQAIARGDVQGMRKTAVSARRHLGQVKAALDQLDKAISKMSR